MKAYQFAIIAVAIFIGGLLLGLSINISVQNPKPEQTQFAINLGIVGVIAEGIAVVQFLMNLFNKPKLDIAWRVWDKDHPLHSALSNAYILTLKVENAGGGQMVESCSAYINIEGVIDFEDALNWLYRGNNQLFAPVVRLEHLELRNIEVQTNYAKNWNVPIKKGSASAEHVDILFIQKDGNIAYLLDAEHKTLEMNKPYSITVTIVAKDLNPKKVNMTIAIPNWNNIKVEAFHVV